MAIMLKHLLAGYKKPEPAPVKVGGVIIKRVARELDTPTLMQLIAQDDSAFNVGSQVRVVKPKASRFVCKDGDTGTVVRHIKAGGCWEMSPRDDLYFVKLDAPRYAGKEMVYLTYNEITAGTQE